MKNANGLAQQRPMTLHCKAPSLSGVSRPLLLFRCGNFMSGRFSHDKFIFVKEGSSTAGEYVETGSLHCH